MRHSLRSTVISNSERSWRRKMGLGPTGVLLKQLGPWSVGILANHIWSFAGSNNRSDVNATFLEAFLSYTTAHIRPLV